MLLSNYETHHFPNPQLPFIYHPHYHLEQAEVETNWHKSIEILCCFQGSGYVRCGSDIYAFRQNDIVAVNSDLLHTIGTEVSLDYCCLIIGSGFCRENGIPTEDLIFHNVIRDKELLELIKNVAAIHQSFDSNALCAIADYRYAALGVLRKLCRDHSTVKIPNISGATSEHIKQAITYIRSNFADRLTLDRIADHIGISKYHLAREFKALTGNTIVGFINTLRCSEAKRLIENGMGVSSAAYACGFENLSYFSKTFQKIIGAQPSSFSKSK